MRYAPTVFDYAVVVLIIVFSMIEIALMPWMRKQRIIAYAYMTAYLWLTAIAILVLWHVTGRSFDQLFLGPTVWWRLVIGFGAAAAFGLLMTRQRTAMLRPKAISAVVRAMDAVAWMMPRTRAEQWWCVALSVAAGVCEEIMFRGFAISFFAYFTGFPPAILLSAFAFGLGHAYQDRKAIVPTGLFGLAMNAVVLVSGSLLPAIAMHVFQDLMMTDAGGRVMRASEDAATSTAAG